MFILYFYGSYHEYHHAKWYSSWEYFNDWRPGEGVWLVPGTDPDDPDYDRYDLFSEEDENEGDEEDETLEYMVDLLDAGEIEPTEFCRQLLSVGYHPDTISEAIAQVAA